MSRQDQDWESPRTMEERILEQRKRFKESKEALKKSYSRLSSPGSVLSRSDLNQSWKEDEEEEQKDDWTNTEQSEVTSISAGMVRIPQWHGEGLPTGERLYDAWGAKKTRSPQSSGFVNKLQKSTPIALRRSRAPTTQQTQFVHGQSPTASRAGFSPQANNQDAESFSIDQLQSSLHFAVAKTPKQKLKVVQSPAVKRDDDTDPILLEAINNFVREFGQNGYHERCAEAENVIRERLGDDVFDELLTGLQNASDPSSPFRSPTRKTNVNEEDGDDFESTIADLRQRNAAHRGRILELQEELQDVKTERAHTSELIHRKDMEIKELEAERKRLLSSRKNPGAISHTQNQKLNVVHKCAQQVSTSVDSLKREAQRCVKYCNDQIPHVFCDILEETKKQDRQFKQAKQLIDSLSASTANEEDVRRKLEKLVGEKEELQFQLDSEKTKSQKKLQQQEETLKRVRESLEHYKALAEKERKEKAKAMQQYKEEKYHSSETVREVESLKQQLARQKEEVTESKQDELENAKRQLRSVEKRLKQKEEIESQLQKELQKVSKDAQNASNSVQAEQVEKLQTVSQSIQRLMYENTEHIEAQMTKLKDSVHHKEKHITQLEKTALGELKTRLEVKRKELEDHAAKASIEREQNAKDSWQLVKENDEYKRESDTIREFSKDFQEVLSNALNELRDSISSTENKTTSEKVKCWIGDLNRVLSSFRKHKSKLQGDLQKISSSMKFTKVQKALTTSDICFADVLELASSLLHSLAQDPSKRRRGSSSHNQVAEGVSDERQAAQTIPENYSSMVHESHETTTSSLYTHSSTSGAEQTETSSAVKGSEDVRPQSEERNADIATASAIPNESSTSTVPSEISQTSPDTSSIPPTTQDGEVQKVPPPKPPSAHPKPTSTDKKIRRGSTPPPAPSPPPKPSRRSSHKAIDASQATQNRPEDLSVGQEASISSARSFSASSVENNNDVRPQSEQNSEIPLSSGSIESSVSTVHSEVNQVSPSESYTAAQAQERSGESKTSSLAPKNESETRRGSSPPFPSSPPRKKDSGARRASLPPPPPSSPLKNDSDARWGSSPPPLPKPSWSDSSTRRPSPLTPSPPPKPKDVSVGQKDSSIDRTQKTEPAAPPTRAEAGGKQAASSTGQAPKTPPPPKTSLSKSGSSTRPPKPASVSSTSNEVAVSTVTSTVSTDAASQDPSSKVTPKLPPPSHSPAKWKASPPPPKAPPKPKSGRKPAPPPPPKNPPPSNKGERT